MRRYPPSIMHRYLDLPSTQSIQTHTSHRHNITPRLQILVQAPYPLPTTHLHHPHYPQPKHRHTSNTPSVPTGLVKPKPNSLIHSPRAKHIHISHTPPTPHIPRTTLIQTTSTALDTIPEPLVPPTCPALTTPHPSLTPALSSTSHHHTLSADKHATQTTVHA